MSRLNTDTPYILLPSASVYLAESLTANPRVAAAQYVAAGQAIGGFVTRVIEAVEGIFERARIRRQLMDMADRMLDDIGLARGDIEAAVAGKLGAAPVRHDAPAPAADVIAMPAKSEGPLVEAILRRAA